MTAPRRRAAARRNDPYTSHEAAATADRYLPTVREAVLGIFRDAGVPMTDDELLAAYRKAALLGHAPRRSTDSSIRSRRVELERDGYLATIDPEVAVGRSRLGGRSLLHATPDVADAYRPIGDGDA